MKAIDAGRRFFSPVDESDTLKGQELIACRGLFRNSTGAARSGAEMMQQRSCDVDDRSCGRTAIVEAVGPDHLWVEVVYGKQG
jgi:hypothetical protein